MLYIKDISHVYNSCTKKRIHFNHLILYTASAVNSSDWFGFMLYYFVRFPGDGPLWTETLGILFDIIVEISKEQVYAFC
jgi:hypothetical protein